MIIVRVAFEHLNGDGHLAKRAYYFRMYEISRKIFSQWASNMIYNHESLEIACH